MKKNMSILGILAMAAMVVFPLPGQKKEWRGGLTLSGAWALYPMAIKWGEEFSKVHPKVRVDI
ncbi:MAG: phosphate ABC transporter substrate-binding protein, partial [Candidatus Aminicenantes bacterium]|nr:phosphate ABC transporter substrate-binding protein [Candidatus Aminicenantes bacterium]